MATERSWNDLISVWQGLNKASLCFVVNSWNWLAKLVRIT